MNGRQEVERKTQGGVASDEVVRNEEALAHKREKIGMKEKRGRRSASGARKRKIEWTGGRVALLFVAVVTVVGLVIWGTVVVILALAGEAEDTTTGEGKVESTLTEMAGFAENGDPEAVVRASARISMEGMDERQRGEYWGMLMNAYYNIGDEASGNYFAEKLGELDTDEEAVGE